MSISSSTSQNPDPSLGRSASGHPLFWVVLAMTILVGISLFRGTPRTEDRDARTGAGSAKTGSEALRHTPNQPSPIAPTVKPSAAELHEAAILLALEKTVDLDYSDRQLEDVIIDLGRQLDIPVWIDRQTLTDEGVALDQPVTLRLTSLPKITEQSALKLTS